MQQCLFWGSYDENAGIRFSELLVFLYCNTQFLG